MLDKYTNLLNIIPGFDISLEENNCLLSLSESLNLICHYKWNLRDVVNPVTLVEIKQKINLAFCQRSLLKLILICST